MPKVGMEPIRRAALVKAAIERVGAAGSLDVTVAQVAQAAGVSAPLAHHYFGGKEALFEAAMRAILTEYGREVRAELGRAEGHRGRVDAVIRASFSDLNFAPDVVAAWLVFYLQAHSRPAFRRLLRVYHRRLRSNLLTDLRPLVGSRAGEVADTTGALIDGLYLRAALSEHPANGADAVAVLTRYLDTTLESAA